MSRMFKQVSVLALAALSLSVTSAFAQPGPGMGQGMGPGAGGQQPSFETMKQHVLAQNQKRAEALQQHNACVQAANDQTALRQCMETERAAMQAMRPQRGGPGGPGKQQ